MKAIIFLLLIICTSCNNWNDGPYFIQKNDYSDCVDLRYSIDGNGSMLRVECAYAVASTTDFIIIQSSSSKRKGFYIINKNMDHKFADYNEFVEGPYGKQDLIEIIGKSQYKILEFYRVDN